MAQWIKDLVLSLQLLGSLLWPRFTPPWPGSFHMPCVWQKKKKRIKTFLNIFISVLIFSHKDNSWQTPIPVHILSALLLKGLGTLWPLELL